jgi:hypothetical protein
MYLNEPQFKIFGTERRILKKELAELKSFYKNYFHYHQLDKDMSSFYGGTKDYPMNDDKANERYNQLKNKIDKLESKLNEPYTS